MKEEKTLHIKCNNHTLQPLKDSVYVLVLPLGTLKLLV